MWQKICKILKLNKQVTCLKIEVQVKNVSPNMQYLYYFHELENEQSENRRKEKKRKIKER